MGTREDPPTDAQCAFAHGLGELKQKTHVPNNYKTQICKQFREQMHCPYGSRCQYLHETQALRQGGAADLRYSAVLRMNLEHFATRLQAQASAADEDVFKTLMEKGAKFKNFYPRPRLAVFKDITTTTTTTTTTTSKDPASPALPHAEGECASPLVNSVKCDHLSLLTGNASDNTAPSDEDIISEGEPHQQ